MSEVDWVTALASLIAIGYSAMARSATHASQSMDHTTQPTKPTLTGIAAELRDMICEYVLADTAAKAIYIGTDVYVGPEPALLKVCRQIRQDAKPIFRAKAPENANRIRAMVREFDFRRLMLFINNLSLEQRDAIAKKQSLRITLQFKTDIVSRKKLLASAAVWLAFCGSRLDGAMVGSSLSYWFNGATPRWRHVTGSQVLEECGLTIKNGTRSKEVVDQVVNAEWKKISKAWFNKYLCVHTAHNRTRGLTEAQIVGANQRLWRELMDDGLQQARIYSIE
ncbi:hypothetical protein LTR27_005996 [Elasticomyces elasticus]|nr:hypothetical protein LTR27_005996 [Elasticomyces elasticus]